MIKVKIKNGRTKVEISGNKTWVMMELVHIIGCCINELSYGKADFERIKQDVINELMKITLTESGDAFEFEFDSE